MAREKFGSRIGFLLVSAGCAIGIGNVWRFPYVTGVNGGAIFVLFYILFLCIMGIPVMTMEFAVGRAGASSAVNAYKNLEKPGQKWHIHGYVCVLGCLMLMMYYTTVSGWMADYFYKFASGSFVSGMSGDEVADVFSSMLANPSEMVFWMALTVVVGFLVVSFKIQSGLEKVTKWMMAALLLLIVILAVRSLTLPGASEGIKFYLLPDIDAAKEQGLWNVIAAAMNQSFFTLSLGVGAMEIFGSYIDKSRALTGEAVRIAILDTFVAVVSGLIIFPACFSYDVAVDNGPSLIFITLPNIFVNMAGGRLWGSLFFLFMTFASFSTVIAVFENLNAFWIDNFNFSRKKSSLVNCIIVFVTGIPCALGYSILKNVHLIGGRDILDSEDFIVSNILLPVGSLIFLLFCVTRFGWGFDSYIGECNSGEGIKMPKAFKYYFKFVLPVLLLVILITGLV